MAIQYSTAVNNARLDAVETTIGASAKLSIFAEAKPANCAAADPGTALVTLELPSNWMADAASAAKELAGSWTGTASGGSGATPQSFRIYATDGTTCGLQGTAGIGSGDLQLNGTITAGQTVTISSFTLNAANT